jgi:hypothetical protein
MEYEPPAFHLYSGRVEMNFIVSSCWTPSRRVRFLTKCPRAFGSNVDGKVEEFPDRSIDAKRWKDLVHRRANQCVCADEIGVF